MNRRVWTLVIFFTVLNASAQENPSSKNDLSTTVPFLSRFHLEDLLPDTITGDLSGDVTLVDLESRPTLTGRESVAGGGLGQAYSYFRRIGLTRMPVREEGRPHFRLNWVPLVTLAFQDMRFESQSVYLAQTDFQMFRTSAGLGPELSLESGYGAVYLSITPGVSYSWVSWSSPVSGGSMAKPNFNLAIVAGIQKTLSAAWVLRVFMREIFEDSQVWDEALDSSQGFDVPVKKVATTTAGISLGYRF